MGLMLASVFDKSEVMINQSLQLLILYLYYHVV